MLNPDKSALRQAMPKDPIAARRTYAGPALFSYGFRPFFLFGALWAALSPLLWMHAYAGGDAMVGTAPALAWHIHEMLFGFAMAKRGWIWRDPLSSRTVPTVLDNFAVNTGFWSSFGGGGMGLAS